MNFIEAHAILGTFSGGPTLSLLVAMSGTSHQLDIYIRAHGARAGYSIEPTYLPFGTLGQHLRAPDSCRAKHEVALLLPWDFVSTLDWRLGLPEVPLVISEAQEVAEKFAVLLKNHGPESLVYLPASIPPALHNAEDCAALENRLESLALSQGAQVLPSEIFALGSYLATGCPIAGQHLSGTAATLVDSVLLSTESPPKVLVTDFDNVLWNGVVAEDGFDGIAYGPEGRGYRHYIFQSLLRLLRQEGILLVGLSRNNRADALKPLQSNSLILRENDFVDVVAGYNAKSSEIRALSDRLGLGLDSFAFVDDNSIELAEIAAALPSVKRFAFPNSDDDMPAFCARLRRAFGKATITTEDRTRTEMYRRRLASMAPKDLEGGDLTDFLRSLRMVLSVNDRSHGPYSRAVQLINKTTQFNLNGRKVSEADVQGIIDKGGILFTANLRDRGGDHGEILALLMDADGSVESFVLSCRVFQRRIEYAFLSWLVRQRLPQSFKFTPTSRNIPIQKFLSDPSFGNTEGKLTSFVATTYLQRHEDALELFQITTQARTDS